jgi:hypothetical protein
MFAMVFKSFLGVFTSVLDACFKCFIYLFYMLQLLHLDVSKVDQMLHMRCAWEAAGAWMTFGAAWATSGVPRAHCWCARSRAPHARRSLPPCADSVWTLAPGSNV